MEATSGILYAVETGIRSKLVAIGATSIEKAATCQQAYFSMKEVNWIDYIAGGMFAAIKNTSDFMFQYAIKLGERK